jgi:preprotein translocase subunit SecY
MHEDSRNAAAPRRISNDWPTLLARIVDDVARIIQTEIRLFQAGLTPILSSAIDRFLANMVALAAFLAGGLCLLAALAFFLHRWLDWAPALGLTGAASLGIGYFFLWIASMHASRSIAELERAFHRIPVRERARGE